MDRATLLLLIDRALNGTISPQEQKELQELLADLSNKDAVRQALQDKWETFEANDTVFSDEQGEAMLRKILNGKRSDFSDNVIRPLFPWFKVVAVVFLATVAWAILDFYSSDCDGAELTMEQAVSQYGIEPGSDKAMIILANGSTVVLDNSNTGLLTEEGGVYIRNLGDGMVRYEAGAHAMGHVLYNTIKIPKGGHYHVVLEDGTKIHLNAESSLRYPVRFAGAAREVQLVGEGFFEVAPDVTRPFLVNTSLQTIRVLGTVFNIRAYPNLKAKTTLVEGQVAVNGAGNTVILTPGETAESELGKSGIKIKKSDINQDLAWHNGYFIFDNEHITSIMERVGRWYDVDVDYKGSMENINLGGVFQRSKSIVQLLESFKTTGLVNFNIKGRRITVIGN
ncbi:DUF4974 domain-containing protein [Parapedobacter sp. ISTM3]|uniref:FecR family protein n=1 Tax=Parapedobacter sp. ISTM3 TaxID=2800130 RepID=UPI00190747D2|nr:FecR family protein [Parapedobacter sp. ISTM3]MBK1440117.1 DUF4974 domain-containing protein [Parapedobacter sp. ISTM3]